MYNVTSLNLSNYSINQPVIEVNNLCIQGINSFQTNMIIILNIAFFMITYFLIISLLNNKPVKKKYLTVLRFVYYVMVLLNGVLFYYWIVL